MSARATQPAGYPPGRAHVNVAGAGAVDIDTLEVCVSRLLDDIQKHLDPGLTGEAWTTTYAWFRPVSPRLEGSALLFDLEPSVTWHLRPHAPLILRLRDARGMRREERLTWPPIRLPSQAPQGYVSPAARPPKPAGPPFPSESSNGSLDDTLEQDLEAAFRRSGDCLRSFIQKEILRVIITSLQGGTMTVDRAETMAGSSSGANA